MNEQAAGRTGRVRIAAPAPIRPSERSANVHYAIRDIMVLAAQAKAAGKDLLFLNIGDPPLFGFNTPPHVIEAAHRAMLDGHNGYAPSAGTEVALEAIRREALARGIRNIQDVFVTSGVSEGIEISLAALMDPGDNLLIPSPGYPLYEATLAKLGFEGVYYHLDEADGWQPDVDEIARLVNHRTRGIVVINPNNPTGAVFRCERLRAILEIAARNGLLPIADEIYDKLLFDPGEYAPLASLAPEQPVLTFNGLSKAYLAPGFRIGWGILSGSEADVAEYREAMAKMCRVRLCASHPAQYSIPAALDGDQGHIPAAIERLRRRRDVAMSLLNSFHNIRCFVPQATFYAFPRIEIERTDQEFVHALIRETGVIVVPGSGFGQRDGTRHFRIVFLPSEDVLTKALTKIGEFARAWR